MTERIVTELNPNLQKLEDAYRKEFSAANELNKALSVKAVVGEELLLVEALQEHLGRLVTTDDFKKCEMRFVASKQNQYTFCYDGKPLGLVKRIYGSCQQPNQFQDNFTISYTIEFHKIKS